MSEQEVEEWAYYSKRISCEERKPSGWASGGYMAPEERYTDAPQFMMGLCSDKPIVS